MGLVNAELIQKALHPRLYEVLGKDLMRTIDPKDARDRRTLLMYHPRPSRAQRQKIKDAFPDIVLALDEQDQKRAIAIAEKAGIPAENFEMILQDPSLLIRFTIHASLRMVSD